MARESTEEIRDGVRETNQRITETNDRLERGFAVVGARIDAPGDRIDSVLLGEHREEHVRLRERVSRLEEHLGLTR